MRRLFGFFFIALAGSLGHGQNLVPDGGFELLDPGYNSGTPFLSNAQFWDILNATPDHLHDNNGGSIWPIISWWEPHNNGIGHAYIGSHNDSDNELAISSGFQLVAGQTYHLECWVWATVSQPFQLQMEVSTSPPSNFLAVDPEFEAVVHQNGGYQKFEGCFTVSTSGTHYLSIGDFSPDGPDAYIHIDDVSITAISAPLPSNPVISGMQSEYCTSQSIIADGSSSTGVGEYQWVLYKLVGGLENYVGSAPVQTGTPSTFNVSNYLGLAVEGECYRVKLLTFGSCSPSVEFDFCFNNPTSVLINDNGPYCHGDNVTLFLTGGSSNWNYEWKQGGTTVQNGVGLTTLGTSADIGNNSYSVVVTASPGCTYAQNKTIVVHDPNNLAPQFVGDLVYYGEEYTTPNIIPNLVTVDANGEIVEVPDVIGNPSLFWTDPPVPMQSQASLLSVTTGLPPGEYPLPVTATDNNSCGVLSTNETVVYRSYCHFCEECIYYENYSPGNNPLPAETKAANCIRAGLSQAVSVGSSYVEFLAGNEIELGPFFNSGPNFQAIIDEATCVEECDDCCDNPAFTIDLPMPNVFTPNGNGVNDYWFPRDQDNLECAYNAVGHVLIVINRWGRVVYTQTSLDETHTCCVYQIDPSATIGSQIYWDGTRNTGNGILHNGWYTVYLTLISGCGYPSQTYQTAVFRAPGSNQNMIAPPPVPDEILNMLGNSEVVEAVENGDILGIESALHNGIRVYPNPSKGVFHLELENTSSTSNVVVLDLTGRTILNLDTKEAEIELDLTGVSSGTYYLEVTNGSMKWTELLVRE